MKGAPPGYITVVHLHDLVDRTGAREAKWDLIHGVNVVYLVGSVRDQDGVPLSMAARNGTCKVTTIPLAHGCFLDTSGYVARRVAERLER